MRPLVELETDKAAQDVMAQDAGTIEEIIANTGQVVKVGAVLARVRVGGEASCERSPVCTPVARRSRHEERAVRRAMAAPTLQSLRDQSKRATPIRAHPMPPAPCPARCRLPRPHHACWPRTPCRPTASKVRANAVRC